MYLNNCHKSRISISNRLLAKPLCKFVNFIAKAKTPSWLIHKVVSKELRTKLTFSRKKTLPIYCIYSSFRAMFASLMILVRLFKRSGPMGCVRHLWHWFSNLFFTKHFFFCSRISTFFCKVTFSRVVIF